MINVRTTLFFAALFLSAMSGVAIAESGSATVQAMNEEVAKNRALSKVPQGSTPTDLSCRSQEVGAETAYTCTVKWD
tara:strand:- start:205 stop:435 length:231 start_codon:yes stop_codon:yes gene_type:complete